MELVGADAGGAVPLKAGAKKDSSNHMHCDDMPDDDGPQINQGTIFYLQQRKKMEELSTNVN